MTDLASFLQQLNSVQLVRWVFCDMNGNARAKLIPGSMSAHFVAKQPRRFCTAVIPMACNSDLPELAWVLDNGYPDCEMIPEPDTFHLVSWSMCSQPGSIGQVICSTRWPEDGTPVAFDPRNVLSRQIDRLNRRFGIQFDCSTELQWHLCQRLEDRQSGTSSWSWAEAAEPNGSSLMHRHEVLISDLCDALRSAGISAETVSTGLGAGQFCVSLASTLGARAADQAFLGREIVKQVAANYGLTATFMPTPHPKAGYSLFRINHTLVLNSDSNSEDYEGRVQPPPMLRHWLAGLVHHSAGIAALGWPTLNCYRSEKPGRRVSWNCPGSAAGQSVAGLVDFRIRPIRSTSDSSGFVNCFWRVENNLPSSAASAHIALAAMVAAGTDGVLKKLELPEKVEDAPLLPANMTEGLEALKVDSVLTDALGDQLAEFYRQAKLQFDLTKVIANAYNSESASEALKREADFYLEFH